MRRKIKDAGLDPTRFAEFVKEIPAPRRGEFFTLLDQAPGLMLQAKKNSPEEAILKAAMMTVEERAAWAKERSAQHRSQ